MLWLKNTANKFADDCSGMAMVYVTILLPVIVGFSVLVIDMSRIGNLHADLQKGADSYALAAAAELDGAPDSWTRAERALENLVENTTKFSTAGFTQFASSGAVTVNPSAAACRSRGAISWCFLKTLPALDSSPITSTQYAATAFETRFIEVKVIPTGFANIFPISYLSGDTADNAQNVSTAAVAGFLSGVCDFTPFYICNPYESGAESLETVMSMPSKRKRMIELRRQGGSTAQNSPGNYGFLMPPPELGNGASVIHDMIANISSPACYSGRLVEVKTGFIASVRRPLAVRFDVYEGSYNGKKNDANYAPANNVRKGYSGSSCSTSEEAEPTVDYQRLPKDDCFDIPNCSIAAGRVGNGEWDFHKYWRENNFLIGTKPRPIGANGLELPIHADGQPTSTNANAPSRYDMYRYEIDQGFTTTPSVGGEIGTPACSSQTAPVGNDRRLVYGAIIDCTANPIGNGASGPPVPPRTFASFFLTEMVEAGGDQIIRVELVDTVKFNGSGTLTNFLRDEAQLFR